MQEAHADAEAALNEVAHMASSVASDRSAAQHTISKCTAFGVYAARLLSHLLARNYCLAPLHFVIFRSLSPRCCCCETPPFVIFRSLSPRYCCCETPSFVTFRSLSPRYCCCDNTVCDCRC